jgi:hypothetical protein
MADQRQGEGLFDFLLPEGEEGDERRDIPVMRRTHKTERVE